MGEPFIGVEATGVYKGVLVEDMIETVAREHKLYCNVYIEDFFQKESDYPLTFVPLWAMSLPLRKDDVVLIEFHQGNLMYPVLYKNNSELDEAFYENFEIPDFINDGNIEKPETKDTIGVTRLGVDSYIIKTDDYTIIHQNNGFIMIDTEDNIYTYGTNVNLVSNGNLKIDCSGDIDVKAVGDGHISIDSDNGEINVNCGDKTNVEIGGETTITCKDKTNITSEGDLTITAKKKTDITSEGEMTVNSKNKTNITSQGELNIVAKNKTTIDSTGELKITSKNKASVESTAQMDIKVNGAAGINITSGASGVTINNHLKVL